MALLGFRTRPFLTYFFFRKTISIWNCFKFIQLRAYNSNPWKVAPWSRLFSRMFAETAIWRICSSSSKLSRWPFSKIASMVEIDWDLLQPFHFSAQNFNIWDQHLTFEEMFLCRICSVCLINCRKIFSNNFSKVFSNRFRFS